MTKIQDISTSSYGSYRANPFEGWIAQVKFDHEPYYKQIHIYMDWLNDQEIPYYYDDTLAIGSRFFFKSEEDKVLFILRWV